MIRRPPRSTRTDTLVPYTTLFRSAVHHQGDGVLLRQAALAAVEQLVLADARGGRLVLDDRLAVLGLDVGHRVGAALVADQRSEERRVGKECVSPCRSRWSPYH